MIQGKRSPSCPRDPWLGKRSSVPFSMKKASQNPDPGNNDTHARGGYNILWLAEISDGNVLVFTRSRNRAKPPLVGMEVFVEVGIL